MNVPSSLLFIAGTCLLACSAMAKGPTVQLSISGPGMTVPVHTADPAAISVHVWGGDFAKLEEGSVDEPEGDLPSYSVHFWVQLGENRVEMKYTVKYVWDTDLRKAYVYLPGPRDLLYRNNSYSIYRKDHDGRWFHASEKWGQSIRTALENAPAANNSLQWSFESVTPYAKAAPLSQAAELRR